MAVLFIVFAVAMGVATFIENDFGTQTSKALVYNTWWFELIMALFVVNFFGNIFRYRLLRKEKWTVLMFHLAFLFILIGAGITRYISYEGIMVIDEGQTTNEFYSDTNYLNIVIDNNQVQKTAAHEMLLSAWGKNSFEFTESFKPNAKTANKEFNFKLVDYIPWAEKKFTPSEDGVEHLFFVESSEGKRHEHHIKRGKISNIHNILIGFDAQDDNASINFFYDENGSLKMRTKKDGDWFRMADKKRGKIVKDSVQHFQFLTLHNVAGMQFVIPRPAEKGEVKTVRGPKNDKKFDVVVFDVTSGEETKRIQFTGGKFNVEGVKEFSLNGLNFRAWYGAKKLYTPFKLKLNDFQLEKYPGSESAAAYASEVTVIDPKETFDYRIYMNHILDYKGYKFFQSSYKNAGKAIEQTHLSVNHDFWGMLVTYIGYSLLYIGMISLLFDKGTRFNDLKKMLRNIRKKKATLSAIAFFLFLGFGNAQHTAHNHATKKQTTKTHQPKRATDAQIDSILKANLVSKEQAEAFSKLIIQDTGGRMKPAHTFASELVRKVAHTNNYKGMTPSQILLSITENPRFWFEVPFIYLAKSDNKKIRKTLGVSEDAEFARLSDFVTPNGAYKIKEQVSEAQKTKIQNKFQQDLIKIDRRISLLYSAISGVIMRIYPIPNDENNRWASQPETLEAGFKGTDSVFVRQSLPVYFQLLREGKKSGDYSQAANVLEGIKKFQQKYGASVIPTEDKINTEIKYNELQIFKKLSSYYRMVGSLLAIFVILQIFFSKSKFLKYTVKLFIGLTILLFVAHILGLGMRWYISGNAPWSNAYESLIYVAWSTMLFGLWFGRKSALTIAAAAFLASTILFYAHLNWLDPEIANLQPVLNSWWLLVHVSIIVSAYGPFGLGMILGIVTLLLMIFTTKKNKKKMAINIKELTIINEMALTVGLVLFTVGNFLGGMWANESWGRYWGWDPKETWALISIMLYAFVLHMRLIPGLRGIFTFNLSSIIVFYSVMMTYMGVNFYLSGLHSYASGDRVITPSSVYYSIAFVTILSTLAWFKYKKYLKK